MVTRGGADRIIFHQETPKLIIDNSVYLLGQSATFLETPCVVELAEGILLKDTQLSIKGSDLELQLDLEKNGQAWQQTLVQQYGLQTPEGMHRPPLLLQDGQGHYLSWQVIDAQAGIIYIIHPDGRRELHMPGLYEQQAGYKGDAILQTRQNKRVHRLLGQDGDDNLIVRHSGASYLKGGKGKNRYELYLQPHDGPIKTATLQHIDLADDELGSEIHLYGYWRCDQPLALYRSEDGLALHDKGQWIILTHGQISASLKHNADQNRTSYRQISLYLHTQVHATDCAAPLEADTTDTRAPTCLRRMALSDNPPTIALNDTQKYQILKQQHAFEQLSTSMMMSRPAERLPLLTSMPPFSITSPLFTEQFITP